MSYVSEPPKHFATPAETRGRVDNIISKSTPSLKSSSAPGWGYATLTASITATLRYTRITREFWFLQNMQFCPLAKLFF